MLILEILYFLSALLLALYGLNSLLLTWLGRRQVGGVAQGSRADALPEAPSKQYPRVTVQLPIYNERYVAERLLEAVVRLNWPADRLQIQVLDDSTDETRQLIAAAIARHQAQGVSVQFDHRHRTDRRR